MAKCEEIMKDMAKYVTYIHWEMISNKNNPQIQQTRVYLIGWIIHSMDALRA